MNIPTCRILSSTNFFLPRSPKSPRRTTLIWMCRSLQGFVAGVTICGTVHAEDPHQEVCQRVGTLASAIARARDSGLSQAAAITAVQSTARPAESATVVETAKLLYERFKQMSPDDAAFEFMLDCLDDPN